MRLVMESEAMDKDVPHALEKAGIPIIGDNREGLMHNKFAIIDSQEVWTGSLNYTSTSAYKDNNNLVRLRSPQIVQDYQAEFDELFTDGLFGPSGEENTPYSVVNVGGAEVEVYFSPDDGVAQHVVDIIKGASKSVDFMVYSFTSDDIGSAVLSRSKAGVKVRGVFDEGQMQSNQGTEYDALKRARLNILLDGNSGLLHDKVFIVNGQIVITGSYNFSASAENSNDENLIIIHDPTIAALYLQEFEKIWQHGK